MMGSKERHFAPLINVSVEQLVPHDHFYRHLERTLDLTFVRKFVEKIYAGGGHPSIDPIVFFKLQLVKFFKTLAVMPNLLGERRQHSPYGSDWQSISKAGENEDKL